MQPPEIDKPLAVRMQELMQALLVISDCLELIRQGRSHQFIPLCGQLRALLTERTKGADPLLLQLANLHGEKLTFYSMPGIDDPAFPESVRSKTILHFSGFPLSLHQMLPGQRPLSFKDFLDEPIFLIRKRKYTTRDVVAEFANKAGGAHYSRRRNEDIAAFSANTGNDPPLLASALVQLGEITLAMGVELLKKLVDFDMHLLLAIPKQTLAGPVYLIDSGYPGTDMRTSLLLTRNLGLEFRASGLGATRVQVTSDRLLDWSAVRDVEVRLHIEHDLSTVVEVTFDAVRVGRSVVPLPVFVASNELHYDTYLGRSVDDEPQHASFGLAYCAKMRVASDRERFLLFRQLADRRSDPNLKCALYEPGSYGRARPGESDLKMTGPVRLVPASELVG